MRLSQVSHYTAPDARIIELPTAEVESYRLFPTPRDFTAVFLDDIAANGVLTPLRVFTDGSHAVLRDGHHRLRAATELRLPALPVQVMPDRLTPVYDTYSLPSAGPKLRRWLKTNRHEFLHASHLNKRGRLNDRITIVVCHCGATWREVNDDGASKQHRLGARPVQTASR